MRRCSKCEEHKNLSEFHRDSTNASGYRSLCKMCIKAYMSSPRVREIKRVAQQKYAKSNKGKAVETKHSKKRWEKVKALGRDKVYYMVRKNLEKQPCCRCGDSKAEAHHHDYSKPLDVTWLCARHHAEEHREQRRA